MQFTSVAVVAALAATVAAWPKNATSVDYVTETYTSYTTYCPSATVLTYNSVTYTVTEATTLTITNCPCTVTKPVTTSSYVYCSTCAPTTAPVYANTTTAVKTSVGTTSVKTTATPTPSTITASSGNKLFAMSGASLAGLVGLAAYLL
jgi:hypothetical protein